jgi:hypothetical protein
MFTHFRRGRRLPVSFYDSRWLYPMIDSSLTFNIYNWDVMEPVTYLTGKKNKLQVMQVSYPSLKPL